MGNKFANIGFNSYINTDKVVAVLSSETVAAESIAIACEDLKVMIDCTGERRPKAILVTDSDSVLLSALSPTTLCQRFNDNTDSVYDDKEEIQFDTEYEYDE